jgi:hypothetical protein
VSAKRITHKLVRQLADDLRARYGLDNEGMRALGSRLADSADTPSSENSSSGSASPRSTAGRSTGSPSKAAQLPPRWQPSLEDYIDIVACVLGADRAAITALRRLPLVVAFLSKRSHRREVDSCPLRTTSGCGR